MIVVAVRSAKGLRAADWSFGGDPPSVGKFVGRWAMQLYLGSTVAADPFRQTLSNGLLRSWRWRPQRGCSAAAARHDTAWLLGDVCPPPVAAGSAAHVDVHFQFAS